MITFNTSPMARKAPPPAFSLNVKDTGECEVSVVLTSAYDGETLTYIYNKDEFDKLIARLVAIRSVMDVSQERLPPK